MTIRGESRAVRERKNERRKVRLKFLVNLAIKAVNHSLCGFSGLVAEVTRFSKK